MPRRRTWRDALGGLIVIVSMPLAAVPAMLVAGGLYRWVFDGWPAWLQQALVLPVLALAGVVMWYSYRGWAWVIQQLARWL